MGHGRDCDQPSRPCPRRHGRGRPRPGLPLRTSPTSRARIPLALGLAFALEGAALAAPPTTAPLPDPRPRAAAPPAVEPAPQPVPASTCLARLSLSGLRFSPEAAPEGPEACRVVDPVRLEALSGDGVTIAFPDRPLVACGFAEVVASFTREALAPLAVGHLQTRVTAVGTGPGYACRGRNQVPGARVSAHGRGLAIDIAWIALEGRRETVASPSDAAAARYLDTLRRAACGWFATVLGPGSDAAHADHLHLDREPRGRDGESRLCQ